MTEKIALVGISGFRGSLLQVIQKTVTCNVGFRRLRCGQSHAGGLLDFVKQHLILSYFVISYGKMLHGEVCFRFRKIPNIKLRVQGLCTFKGQFRISFPGERRLL